jgi:hypothetical protein
MRDSVGICSERSIWGWEVCGDANIGFDKSSMYKAQLGISIYIPLYLVGLLIHDSYSVVQFVTSNLTPSHQNFEVCISLIIGPKWGWVTPVPKEILS